MGRDGNPTDELDLSKWGRGIWLVKVPKYVASKWEQAPGDMEVGKLNISREPGQGVEAYTLRKDHLSWLGNNLANLNDLCGLEIENVHVISYADYTAIVFTGTSWDDVKKSAEKATTRESLVPEPEILSMEGRIVQKLECRPYADDTYYKMKSESIRKPQRKVQQLDKVVVNFKPVSNHKHKILYKEKKKAEGRRFRYDKEYVLKVLYAAFKKHLYYKIKDLQNITEQPILYLKEILKEYCNYNPKNPHKNMWELKPEYIQNHTHANAKEDKGSSNSD